jgi:hypothetical protein
MNTRYQGWAVFVLLSVACSTPPSYVGPADGSTDSGPSNMTACSDLATAQCTKLETCSSIIMQIKYGSVATCEARAIEVCMNALAAPETGNSAATTEACVQAYPSWACSDYFNNVNSPTACAQPTGKLANGKACAFPAQCVTGYCDVPATAACGVCAPAPSPGQSCATLASCGQGLLCLGAAKVCETYGVAGASCSADVPCGAHLSCIGSEPLKTIAGHCEPSTAMIGARCDPTLDHGPGCDFDSGLVCNNKTKLCEQMSVSQQGGPCDSENEQYTPCGTGGKCSTSEAGATGICAGAAADGKACSISSAGPTCLAPARCIVTSSGSTSGTCQIPTASACK